MGSKEALRHVGLLAVIAAVGSSCARHGNPDNRPRPTPPPIVMSDDDPGLPTWMWRYDRLARGLTRPTTIPSTRPAPLESVDLFARARGAMLTGSRFTALQYLERAREIDPSSAEIHKMYAIAVLDAEGGESGLSKAAASLERAAELDPDDLENWLRLGRVEQVRGRKPQSLRAYEFAVLTTEYSEDPLRATVADLQLARALASEGFDRAALEKYDLVLERLPRLGWSVQENTETALLSQRPEILYTEIAGLYERRGQYRDAAHILEKAVRLDPNSRETSSRHILALARSGSEAGSEAAELVLRQVRLHGGDASSLSLLREVFRLLGREGEIGVELLRLHQLLPDDKAILDELLAHLTSAGRLDEADQVLTSAINRALLRPTATSSAPITLPTPMPDADGTTVREGLGPTPGVQPPQAPPHPAELTRRLAELRIIRHDLAGAAQAVFRVLSVSPAQTDELSRVISRLVASAAEPRLSLSGLLAMRLPDDQAAVRDYFAGQLAVSLYRPTQGYELMFSATRSFHPAVLESAAQTSRRRDLSPARKASRLAELKQRAGRVGGAALLLSLEGQLQIYAGQFNEAVRTLTSATSSGAQDVVTSINLATALTSVGAPHAVSRTLETAAQRWPYNPEAQAVYILHLDSQFKTADADREMNAWLARENVILGAGRFELRPSTAGNTTPSSSDDGAVSARLAQIMRWNRLGQSDRADREATLLLRDAPHRTDVVAAFFALANRSTPDAAGRPVAERRRQENALSELVRVTTAQPRALAAVGLLVRLGIALDRPDEVLLALDRSRKAVAREPDLLYALSVIAGQTDQPFVLEKSLDILSDALLADPSDCVAANDLAYSRAERADVTPDQLIECERLARSAVKANPDSAAYADTLGWVLYKRGDFKGAVEWLTRADQLGENTNVTLIDHLGDACFRHGDPVAARDAWRRALEHSSRNPSSQNSLTRIRLQLKLQISEGGGLPPLAPVPGFP